MTSSCVARLMEESHANYSTPLLRNDEISVRARARIEARPFETVFIADWSEATFLHFEVDEKLLQQAVPFPLDHHDGRSFVTLVAFTMRHLRLRYGGRITEWMTAPIATHQFLNLRTYVQGRGGEGIFFMHEWLNNRFAVAIGPATFGLPYRPATLDYHQDTGYITGQFDSPEGRGGFAGRVTGPTGQAIPGSRDAFFLERYTAYTAAGFRPLFFRVWHPPWQFQTLELEYLEAANFLSGLSQRWVESLRFVGACYSEGVEDVWMGRPHAA